MKRSNDLICGDDQGHHLQLGNIGRINKCSIYKNAAFLTMPYGGNELP